MKRETISRAVGEIDARYIEEAEVFGRSGQKAASRKAVSRKGTSCLRKAAVLAAAVLVFCVLAAGAGFLFFREGTVVYAYLYGSGEKLTEAGAVLHTGTISDDGEQTGHPLMFYLSGKGIEQVRFSCKNQQIVFTDWTEKREEYGPAGNFTIPYGTDEDEYPYLTIDWDPKETIQRLHGDYTIETLPGELKEDLIVMEITFADGGRKVKAARVSLLEDGTCFASFGDYEIGPSDSFIKRKDAPTLREQQKLQASEAGKEEAEIQGGEESEGIGSGAAEAEADGAARAAAEAYYAGTVFEVVSMREKTSSETEAVFWVSVKKDGLLQEPERSITMEKKDGVWVVVNEGY